jgi:hypothetical protein
MSDHVCFLSQIERCRAPRRGWCRRAFFFLQVLLETHDAQTARWYRSFAVDGGDDAQLLVWGGMGDSCQGGYTDGIAGGWYVPIEQPKTGSCSQK